MSNVSEQLTPMEEKLLYPTFHFNNGKITITRCFFQDGFCVETIANGIKYEVTNLKNPQ